MREDYVKWRKKIYDPLREEGLFTWDSLYGEEYALAAIHPITDHFRNEIVYATEKLGLIFHKTVKVIQGGANDLLKELGIPPRTWGAIRLDLGMQTPTVIGRFDFANTPQGLKMLEFNSDTPTSIVEAYYVNERVCNLYEWRNPNHKMDEGISSAFQHVVNTYKHLGYPCTSIYFSSLEWHKEDVGTTLYLMKQSGLLSKFVPLKSLAVKGEGLFSYDHTSQEYHPVDVLYRLHALELLAEDADQDGYPTGKHILELIAKRKLAIINPPSGFICQTKALQALIWNLSEIGAFFDNEEREIIHSYMLPTYLDNPFYGKTAYVQKPIFGREGDSVTLYDRNGATVASNPEQQYKNQLMIYQEKVDLEIIEVPTMKGWLQGKLLWGSFLLDGKASAIVARVDQEITGDMSYFLPVGIRC